LSRFEAAPKYMLPQHLAWRIVRPTSCADAPSPTVRYVTKWQTATRVRQQDDTAPATVMTVTGHPTVIVVIDRHIEWRTLKCP